MHTGTRNATSLSCFLSLSLSLVLSLWSTRVASKATATCESACAQTIQKVQTGGSLDTRGPAGKEVRPSANGPVSTVAGVAQGARSGSLGSVGVPPPLHWQKVVDFSNRRLRFLTCSPEQNAEFSQVLCTVALFTVHTVHCSLSSTALARHSFTHLYCLSLSTREKST